MRRIPQFTICFIVILSLLNSAIAQDTKHADAQKAAVTLTASATGGRVRFTAPSSVVQIRLEVYDSAGRKLFDNEVRDGSVLDWLVQDGQAQRLRDDTYLCVVTVKSISGKITQKLTSVIVESAAARLQAVDATQLTAQQSQAVGPVEDDSALTILREDEPRSGTVIAHDGEEGQITRSTGALSFRLGDFFSGKDVEQMRLTAEGNLGIGITHPEVRLEVDGLIRASQGIVFPDGSIQYSAASRTLGAKSSAPGASIQSSKPGKNGGQEHIEAAGTGTVNHIAKWTETGGAGTLGDTGIVESASGNVGIGTSSPDPFKLNVNGNLNIGGSNLYLGGFLRFTDNAAAGYTNFMALKGNLTNFDGVNYEQLNLYNPGGDKAIHLGQTASGSQIASIGSGNTTLALQPSAGNVVIGTTNTGAKLDVAGDISASQYNIAGLPVLTTWGGANAAVGIFAGNSISDLGLTWGNSFFGYSAGSSNTLGGNHNSFFGNYAGSTNTIGFNNTLVGAKADVGFNNLANASAIGAMAYVTQSNSMVLGMINGINGANADTNVGIGTTAPASRLDIAVNGGHILIGHAGCASGFTGLGFSSGLFGASLSGCTNYSLLGEGTNTFINRSSGGGIFFREANATQMSIASGGAVTINSTLALGTLGSAGSTALCRNASKQIATCSSSLRYKDRVLNFQAGLNAINRLRPVTFRWKESGQRDIGLVAEEVAKVEPLLVTYNLSGEVEGVKYDRINVLLVNAVKQQQEEIVRLQHQDASIRAQLKGLERKIQRMAGKRSMIASANPLSSR